MTDLPPSLQRLLDVLYTEVDQVTGELESGGSAETWRNEMAATLARGHLAGYMTGQDSAVVDTASRRQLLKDVSAQIVFLDNFVVDIQAAATFQKGWNARAQMYMDAVGASYYKGKFKMWALPAVPRDGTTQCRTRCNCSWDVQELEGEGNADAYWRLGPTEHCQGCVERAAQWSPIRFRGGELQ